MREKPGILLVDDDQFVRMAVQLGLQRDGFDVWSAGNGLDAIELYRQQAANIDVVLLDVRMPGLDGPQTLDALRKLNADVRACFMTGHMGAYETEELRQRGAAHVIGKPFRHDELAAILRSVAQGVLPAPM